MARIDEGGSSGPSSVPHTQGFKVDPDTLTSVADMVKNLLADVSGDTNMTGNLQHYTEKGKGEALSNTQDGLGKLYGTEDNAFSNAYTAVYQGVQKTYAAMKQQLTSLESACRTTAQQYQQHDDDAKTNVTQSGEI